MESQYQPQRKACDLCYRKKIKCDGQTPRCSPCIVYESDCTYRAASRKAPSRKQAVAQRQLREGALESRVTSLEDQLSTVLKKVERLERSAGSEQDAGVSIQLSDLSSLGTPPYQVALPTVEQFLASFNSIFPLFHPATLLQTMESWYLNPHSRDTITWALINVVLALAHHTSPSDNPTLIGNTATYLKNTQSALTEVIMSETDLVNVQVLLGMVMLFWTADDLGPALILISTTLRLAHKLGLHTRKSSEHLCPTLALQRNRVFWMAYILDRDLSLHSRIAPVQLDTDIDLDLPPLETEDDLTGFVFAADDIRSSEHNPASPSYRCKESQAAKTYFFRARVELARIQGQVYDCVYSVSAQNCSSEERAQTVTHVLHRLDEWSSRIPPTLHATTFSQAADPELSKYFCILYSTRIACRALLSFASARDSFHYSRWVGRLQDYGGRIAAGQTGSHAPVPHGWQTLVNECRQYLRLFATVTPKDTFFIRMTICAHNSSLIALTANSIFDASHSTIEFDQQLTKTAMLFLEDVVKQTGRQDFQNVRDAVRQMRCYVDLISQKQHPKNMSPEMSFWGEDTRSDLFELAVCEEIEKDFEMPGVDSYCAASKLGT